MNDPELTQDRDERARRTTSARRGVVAVGAVGALGAAVAIGVNLPTTSATGSTVPDESQQRSTPQWDQSSAGGQLATQGGGGSPQGRSGGS